MFDIEALERQLKIPTHGLTRRRELLARAERRFVRELQENAEAFAAAGRALATLLAQRDAFAALGARYGAERNSNPATLEVSAEDSVPEAVRIAGTEGFVQGDDFVLRTPYASVGPFSVTVPIAMSKSEALALGPVQRSYLVPGYIALCALAQTQWMDPGLLDEAVARAAEHGIIGETLADDLFGCIIDPAVIKTDLACARFAEIRRRHREALVAGSAETGRSSDER